MPSFTARFIGAICEGAHPMSNFVNPPQQNFPFPFPMENPEILKNNNF